MLKLNSRSERRPKRHRQPDSYRTVAIETSVKILTNGLLSVAAIAALVKLLPYNQTQQAKLEEVRAEIEQTRNRVGQLRKDFSRNFDPAQQETRMKEYSPFVDPHQHQIFWINPQEKTP